MGNRFENTYGGAETKIGAVHHFLASAEGDHAAADLHVVGTKLDELLRQHLFQSLEGFGNEFERFLH